MLSNEKLAACLKSIEDEFKALRYADLAAMAEAAKPTEHFVERELLVDGETVGVSILLSRAGTWRRRVCVEVFLFQERPWNRVAYFERFESGRIRQFDRWYDSLIIYGILGGSVLVGVALAVKLVLWIFRAGV